MKKNKVLFICRVLSGYGGTETVLTEVANQLAAKTEIELLVGRSTIDQKWLENFNKDVNIAFVPNIVKIWVIFYYFWLSIALLNPFQKCQIIVLDPQTLKGVNKVRKLLKPSVRIFAWFHFNLSERYLEKYAEVLPLVDDFLVISSSNQKKLVSLGIAKKKVHLIYNPIGQIEDFKQVRRNTDYSTIKLVYIGRVELDGYKNLRFLMRALANIEVPFQIEIIGRTEKSDDLISYAKSLNISQYVSVHSWSSKPWSQVRDVDAFILSSKDEGFGLVLAESIARGLPVICSDIDGGVKDIIQDGVNGVFFSLNDEQSLNQVLLHRISEIRGMKYSAMKQSVKKFYTPVYINKFLDALH